MTDEARSSLDILNDLPAPGEKPEPVVEEAVETPDPDDSGSPEGADPEVVEAPAGEQVEEKVEEAELILGKFKTAEDLQKSYVEIERRAHEASQRAAEYERYIQMVEAQQAEQQAAKFGKSEPQNVDELLALAYEDPDEAFWFAAEKAPSEVASVLTEIRSYDPGRAERLLLQYQHQIVENAVAERTAPVQQHYQQTQHADQAQSLAIKLHSEIASLPNYDNIKTNIAEMLKSRQNLITMENPEAAAQVMRDVYELANLQYQQKVAAADNARRLQHNAAAGTSAGVEAGGQVETPSLEQDENPADVMRNAILNAANASAW